MRISNLSRRSIDNFAIITIVSAVLLLTACNKNPQPTRRPAHPTAAALPTAFDRAELFFEDRNYAEAARYYEESLREQPSHPKADRALFRSGLSRAVPGHSLHDLDVARNHFERLVATHPDSNLKAQSEFILGLSDRLQSLQSNLRAQDSQLQVNRETIAQLNSLVDKLKLAVDKQKSKVGTTEAQLRKRDVKIREAEKQIESLERLLDKYRKINIQSRPSSPPD